MALVELLLLDEGRSEMITSSAFLELVVERREDAAEGGWVMGAELEAIRRAWSLPSRMGQLRARAPITSICFSKEP